MGCCMRKSAPITNQIKVAETDYPLRIRLRLRGDTKEATVANVTKSLCEVINEREERLKVEVTEKDDVYFATVNVRAGDAPGASRKMAQKIINTVTGKGIMLTENVKIVGAKEHLLAGEL